VASIELKSIALHISVRKKRIVYTLHCTAHGNGWVVADQRVSRLQLSSADALIIYPHCWIMYMMDVNNIIVGYTILLVDKTLASASSVSKCGKRLCA
jgi:hypothetical protein